MRELKIAKYQIFESLNAVRIFYMIMILILAFLSIISNGKINSSGVEFATIIFLFVAGLNSFRSVFKFSQANNVSRKKFIKGVIIGSLAITFSMSLFDVIINRIYNLFVKCPTNFDMIYGSLRGLNVLKERNLWTQSNDIYTLFGTFIWQFAIYSTVFIIGILISLTYYRSNKIVKIIISVVPAMLFIFGSYAPVQSTDNNSNINIVEFIQSFFGWQAQNPYIAVLNLGILSIILSMVIYVLTKKAVIKD